MVRASGEKPTELGMVRPERVDVAGEVQAKR
jgi:hypothetical protein